MDVKSMIIGAVALLVLALNVLYIFINTEGNKEDIVAGFILLGITIITTVCVTINLI